MYDATVRFRGDGAINIFSSDSTTRGANRAFPFTHTYGARGKKNRIRVRRPIPPSLRVLVLLARSPVRVINLINAATYFRCSRARVVSVVGVVAYPSSK